MSSDSTTLHAEELWCDLGPLAEVREALADWLTEVVGPEVLSDMQATGRDIYSVRLGEGVICAEVGHYDTHGEFVSLPVQFIASAPPPRVVLEFISNRARSTAA